LIDEPTSGRAVDYVNLGATGLRVSRVCLGMMSFGQHPERPWTLAESDAEPIVRRAVEGGITFFDTADVYNGGESELITGRLVSKLLTREEAVIATKVHGRTMPGENGRGLSRKHILASIDASLYRLGLDYVDLYQIHRWDYATPLEETMEALNDVVRAGKARYLGASSMFAWQFAEARRVSMQHGWARFVSMQNHYNLLYREEEREMIPQCIDQGVGVIPWSPLARGLLAGNRTASGERLTTRANTDAFADSLYTADADQPVIDRTGELAVARGVSSAQIALAWLLQKPGVSAPIVGATKLSHLEHALAACDLRLDEAEIEQLEAPYKPHAIAGHQ
jgi:aryl-alcohol dehydrogenase-like predicted oxidoreductase